MTNDRKYAQTGHPKFYWTLEVLAQKKKDFLIMDSLTFSIFSAVCWNLDGGMVFESYLCKLHD